MSILFDQAPAGLPSCPMPFGISWSTKLFEMELCFQSKWFCYNPILYRSSIESNFGAYTLQVGLDSLVRVNLERI